MRRVNRFFEVADFQQYFGLVQPAEAHLAFFFPRLIFFPQPREFAQRLARISAEVSQVGKIEAAE